MEGSHSGSLVSAGLRKKLQVTKKYEKNYIEVSVKAFHGWTMEPSDIATDNKEQRTEV